MPFRRSSDPRQMPLHLPTLDVSVGSPDRGPLRPEDPSAYLEDKLLLGIK